jgi:UDP-N-acetyl-D-glucosamine dehydrogenase
LLGREAFGMKETAALRRRILGRRATLAVVGQGYAGLSMACAAADAGFHVEATDLDEARIHDLRRGVLSVPGVSEHLFRAGVASGRITFSTRLGSIRESDLVAICVPAAIRDGSPDLAYLGELCSRVGRHLRPGHLVIVESAVFPGATEGLVRPALETSRLSASTDFLLAYSPERIDPGNDEHGLLNTPRIVGGITREATGVAALFFGQFVDKVVQVSSCQAAEMAKFLETTFRHVNIGLVNEIAVYCNQQGMDVWEVVEAAATKPFGFMPFHPGSGVGGQNVLWDQASEDASESIGTSRPLRLVERARSVNSQMPEYVASRIDQALKDKGREVRGARILALGVAYKPNVGDTLESPALKVMLHLMNSGAKVSYHDPYVAEVMLNGDVMGRSQLTERAVEAADCVAILAPHKDYDLDWIARHALLVFDAHNAFGPDRRANVVRL